MASNRDDLANAFFVYLDPSRPKGSEEMRTVAGILADYLDTIAHSVGAIRELKPDNVEIAIADPEAAPLIKRLNDLTDRMMGDHDLDVRLSAFGDLAEEHGKRIEKYGARLDEHTGDIRGIRRQLGKLVTTDNGYKAAIEKIGALEVMAARTMARVDSLAELYAEHEPRIATLDSRLTNIERIKTVERFDVIDSRIADIMRAIHDDANAANGYCKRLDSRLADTTRTLRSRFDTFDGRLVGHAEAIDMIHKRVARLEQPDDMDTSTIPVWSDKDGNRGSRRVEKPQPHTLGSVVADAIASAVADAETTMAMDDANPVRIHYTNHRGVTSYRTIRPVRFWYGKTEYYPVPQYLLTAFDVDKEVVRTFAWSNIHKFGVTPDYAIEQSGLEALRSRIERVRQQEVTMGSEGNWNANAYGRGYYNGIELALATMEGRAPRFRDAPGKEQYDEVCRARAVGEVPGWKLVRVEEEPGATVKRQTIDGGPQAPLPIGGYAEEMSGMQPAEYLLTPPRGVYYNPETNNFYTGAQTGLGQSFYIIWTSRRFEFPQSLEELRKREAELMNREQNGNSIGDPPTGITTGPNFKPA